MYPSDSKPVIPGRFDPLKPNMPMWLSEGSKKSIGPEGWAVFDRIYPTHVRVTVDPGKVSEHVRVADSMAGGQYLHTLAVDVLGWGEVVIAGMVDKQDRCARLVVAVTLDYQLARDLVGLQLDAPLDWQWMEQVGLSDLMSVRARVMMLGLVATWATAQVHDLGPSGSVLCEYARQWQYVEGVAVSHREWWIDLRDPTTWK